MQELGDPVLGFTVYNPDKTEISEFSKSQLYFYSNAMYFVSNKFCLIWKGLSLSGHLLTNDITSRLFFTYSLKFIYFCL